MTQAGVQRSTERSFVWLAGCALAVLLLYWPAATVLAQLWTDDERQTYTHGFLVAAIAAWLLWRRRALATDAFPVSWQWRLSWCALLLGSLVSWQLLYRAGISTGYVALLPVLIISVVAAILGPSGFRAASVPVAFLAFGLPIWDFLNPLAVGATIHVVRFLLRVFGVPAHFEEHFVQVPDGLFAIEGGCSGLHFLVSALAVSALLGELRNDTLRMRIRWVLLALGLALLANWLRVFSIIVIGHVTEMQHYLVRESHYGYGWVVFALALVPLFLLERRTPTREFSAPERPSGSGGRGPNAVWAAVVVTILAVPPLLDAFIVTRADAMATSDWMQSPPDADGWSAISQFAAWRPFLQNPDAERRWVHRADPPAPEVAVYVARYDSLGRDKEFAGFGSRLAGEAEIVDSHLEVVDGLSFLEASLEEGGTRSLLWARYLVDDRAFTHGLKAQLWYSWRTLLALRSVRSVVWAAHAPCVPDCAAARASLTRLVRDMEIQ